MFPRVAFEYGQTSWAASTSFDAMSGSRTGRETLRATARP
ncbi:hypothetical protein SALBM311S_04173 [Streptomyces alboniger]